MNTNFDIFDLSHTLSNFDVNTINKAFLTTPKYIVYEIEPIQPPACEIIKVFVSFAGSRIALSMSLMESVCD